MKNPPGCLSGNSSFTLYENGTAIGLISNTEPPVRLLRPCYFYLSFVYLYDPHDVMFMNTCDPHDVMFVHSYDPHDVTLTWSSHPQFYGHTEVDEPKGSQVVKDAITKLKVSRWSKMSSLNSWLVMDAITKLKVSRWSKMSSLNSRLVKDAIT